MTTIHVGVVHTIGTTRAWPEPHVVMTHRTILGVTDNGPCLSPYTVVSGDTKTVIACGVHEPAERQCFACRISLIETVTAVRYDGPNLLFVDQDGWLFEVIKGDANV